MWVHVLRVSVALVMWVLAIATMVVRSLGGPPTLTGWSMLLAIGAAVFTGWHLLVLERMRVESVARFAAECALRAQPLESVN